MTRPYRDQISFDRRGIVSVSTFDGVRVEARSDRPPDRGSSFEVRYDGSGLADGVQIFVDGVRLHQTILSEPPRRP